MQYILCSANITIIEIVINTVTTTIVITITIIISIVATAIILVTSNGTAVSPNGSGAAAGGN
ncbi:MAG TPA: hypothetical protein VFF49_08465 [Thermodesulfobacteriota bacterium]|nr:hypothetical protein [Thermodesulfobacteriota bacterium]